MKKSLFLSALIALSSISCKEEIKDDSEFPLLDSTEVVTDGHNAMNALDYHGVYYGVLPCADCEGIETTITLTADSYTKEVVYQGKSKEIITEKGTFTWNEAGNTITLSGSQAPNQYFVGENDLFHLDVDGDRIEGKMASKYRLQKLDTTTLSKDSKVSEAMATGNEARKIVDAKVELKKSKWRLVKMNGNVVKKDSNIEKEYGITFNPDGRFSAFAGCNNMMGSYKLKEDVSRIEFSKVASTMMACEDMITEQELAKVLEMADNYNFDGKTLKLNKARMATLAEFEIIK
ncbi:copper resistance protein NlpE N-terminal domain-containing protein [Flavobacterium cheniae]|uniref:Putative lipoprotein NlpE involved in copper resistance n=1 Tax=Flavobacterium cheniae TaxID=295428 RepID=A0A562KNV3_9FLAO|nr:copper resistance protein NlpE N-terminal domain-containing protein [Flavobacterium cheniae]TDR23096.1 putative lipoprotein NlpE involved in copper resistance [Flavobacterium cheniae]TWH97044.1 putative lipoprotein NlpE involved in copper resistance [Flavobacterium cheniae]